VSLLMLPAVIRLRDNNSARYAIAAIALLVLAGAIAFSKRKAEAMDAGLPVAPAPRGGSTLSPESGSPVAAP
jgi:hypothetical protein